MSEPARYPHALRWLIVGADGLIGRHLHAALQLGGAYVEGTSRRWGSSHRLLDLAASPGTWVLPEADVVVIAAAVPRIADCEQDEEGTARINVAAPQALAQYYWGQGAFVVFLSSSGVFDGVQDQTPGVQTQPHPLNAYGRQKAEAEFQLLRHTGSEHGLAIIRPTKILGEDTPILREWQAALAAGEPIRPHAWRCMAPISVAWAVRAILIVAAAREQGIWHLSSATDINFAEFARQWAQLRGFPANRIQPEERSDLPPQRARLDMRETTERFAIAPPMLADTLISLQGSVRD